MSPILAFVLLMLISFSLPLILMRYGKHFLMGLVPIYLLVGNAFSESFFTVYGVTQSLALPIFSAVFLVTDMLSEHFGKEDAKKAIWIGLIAQLYFVLMIIIIDRSDLLPEFKSNYTAVYDVLPRLIIGSFIAYVISQFFDIHLFHWLKEKLGEEGLFWRNNISTGISQLLDTFLLTTIAFYGVAPFETVKELLLFVLSTWILKLVVRLIDYPFILASKKIYRTKIE